MAGISIKVRGANELIRQLRELGDKLQKKVMRQAFNEAASQLLNDAKSRAPADTGRLRNALKMRRATIRRGSVRSGIYADLGEKREDTNGAYYAPFVEFGSTRQTEGGVTTVAAQPFIRPAFDADHERIADQIEQGIDKFIQAQNK